MIIQGSNSRAEILSELEKVIWEADSPVILSFDSDNFDSFFETTFSDYLKEHSKKHLATLCRSADDEKLLGSIAQGVEVLFQLSAEHLVAAPPEQWQESWQAVAKNTGNIQRILVVDHYQDFVTASAAEVEPVRDILTRLAAEPGVTVILAAGPNYGEVVYSFGNLFPYSVWNRSEIGDSALQGKHEVIKKTDFGIAVIASIFIVGIIALLITLVSIPGIGGKPKDDELLTRPTPPEPDKPSKPETPPKIAETKPVAKQPTIPKPEKPASIAAAKPRPNSAPTPAPAPEATPPSPTLAAAETPAPTPAEPASIPEPEPEPQPRKNSLPSFPYQPRADFDFAATDTNQINAGSDQFLSDQLAAPPREITFPAPTEPSEMLLSQVDKKFSPRQESINRPLPTIKPPPVETLQPIEPSKLAKFVKRTKLPTAPKLPEAKPTMPEPKAIAKTQADVQQMKVNDPVEQQPLKVDQVVSSLNQTTIETISDLRNELKTLMDKNPRKDAQPIQDWALRMNAGKKYFEVLLAEAYAEKNDLESTFAWFQKHANRTNLPSDNYIVGAAQFFGKGTPVDYQAALTNLNRAKTGGDAEAAYLYGIAQLEGLGLEKDAEEAYDTFTSAIDMGSKLAYREAGRMQELGLGTDQNFAMAYETYREGALKGDAYCFGRIIQIIENGQYNLFEQDLEKGLELREVMKKMNLDPIQVHVSGVVERDFYTQRTPLAAPALGE